ncbi:MAG: hypothetical protein KA175_00420 [Flavobacteriales bacterium]|nr:hypothetical protein [Flavobacteriales bacterium]MBP6696048.1 hypothetical protein [Flavobacteriales bacterium]
MKNNFLLSIALLTGCGAFGQTSITWGNPLACNTSGQGTYRPRIALNGNGDPVVIWGDMNPNRNYVTVGTGSSFTGPVEVSMPGCEPAVADFMGSSIAANGNTVWVVMKAQPEDTRPVYVRRSNDGGMTWGDTIRVDPYDGHLSRFPSIDVADPDAPLVQYMQFDNGFAGARHVVTQFDGTTFTAPVQVSSPFAPGLVCDCCPSQIVAEGTRAVALYRNAGPNIRVLWAATSDDAGASFPIGAEVDNTGWMLTACPSSGPDGYLAGDSIRYVWMSGANNGTKVYIGSALASDLTLGGQGFVHPGQMSMLQQNFPRIAGSGDTLGVVWQQHMSGQYEVLFSWSVTGPGGLSVPDTVNLDLSGAQKTPDIAYADGTFHIVWSEGPADMVRYRQATLTSTVGLAEVEALPVITSWPNPVHDLLHVQGSQWTAAAVLDVQGKVMARLLVRDGTIDMTSLAPGSYTAQLEGLGGAQGLVRILKQ